MTDPGKPKPPPRVPYTQFVGSQDVPPPYYFPEVTVHAFVWEAETAPIQAYCDAYLNVCPDDERAFDYGPATMWPYVMLYFLEYPNMISANTSPMQDGEKPYSDRGITSQSEVFIALPVMRYGRGLKGLLTETEMECVLPFIAVSEPWSCVCGREMLGLGKVLAHFELGESEYPDSFSATVSLPGWASNHGMQELRTLINVDTKPTLPTFRHGSTPESTLATLVDNRAAEWAIQNLATVSNFIDFASLGLIPTSMRTVGLKQYRDAEKPNNAVYQALVSCTSRYSNVRDLRLFSEADVDIYIDNTGSFHDLTKVLFGVDEDSSSAKFKPEVAGAFRFTADISYAHMDVIHEFPISDRPGHICRKGSSDLTARWFRPIKGFFGSKVAP